MLNLNKATNVQKMKRKLNKHANLQTMHIGVHIIWIVIPYCIMFGYLNCLLYFNN